MEWERCSLFWLHLELYYQTWNLCRASSGWASFYFIIFVVVTSMIFQSLFWPTLIEVIKVTKSSNTYSVYRTVSVELRRSNFSGVRSDSQRYMAACILSDLRGAEHPMVAILFSHMRYWVLLVPGNDSIELEAFLELIRMTKHRYCIGTFELHEEHELTKFENFQKEDEIMV